MRNTIIKERVDILISFKEFLSQYKRNFCLLFVVQFMFILGAFLTPYLYGILIDEVMINKRIKVLYVICLGYISIYCLNTILTIFQKYLQVKTFNSLKISLKNKIWNQYMKAPFCFYINHCTGDLKQRIDKDVDITETFIVNQIITFVYNILLLIFYSCIIFFISWKLFIFSMMMIPISFWLTKCMAKGSSDAWSNYRDDYGKYESWLQTSLQNWKEIKVLNLYKNQLNRLENEWKRLMKNFYKGSLYFFMNRSFIGFSEFFITKMNIYFVGGLLIFAGDLKIGSLFVFIKYYEGIYKYITEITKENMNLQEYKESLNRIIEVLEYDFEEPTINNTTIKAGNLRFNNVTFQYEGNQTQILKNVNFEIKDKQCVVIMGKSGSGKSTIIKLLLKLYENYNGNIYINEVDIKKIKRKVLYSNIGVVLQDSILFNGSIIDNMKMVKSDVTIKEIVDACKMTNIHEEIMQMPNTYHTIVGERGIQLSGGQRQRILIARILLSNPKIIILDEATSAIDFESEKAIYESINKIKKYCTIIIITHKVNTLLLSDFTIMIDESKSIIE